MNGVLMNITQETVDYAFEVEVPVNHYQDCLHICKVILKNFNVTISLYQAEKFWKWRSNELDASFIGLENDDKICAWFRKYVIHMFQLKSPKKTTENPISNQQTNKDSRFSDIVNHFVFDEINDFLTKENQHNRYKRHPLPRKEENRCSECGIELGSVMGYVCPSTKCPTGLGQIYCGLK